MFCFLQLILINILCLCLESHSTNRSNGSVNSEYIPFIVGLCLMALVIVVLLTSLVACLCIKRDKEQRNCKYGAMEMVSVKAVQFTTRKEAIQHDHKDVPLPKINDTCKMVMDPPDRKFASANLKVLSGFRRASVPTDLMALEEAPSYLELGSRRISLSYNCLSEPLDRVTKESVVKSDDEKLYMPETDSTMIRQYLSDKREENVHRKYSVYDDETLRADNYFSRFGRIFFSMQYNCDDRILNVTIIKAQHLIGNRIKGKNRFYIKLRLKKAAVHQSISVISLSGLPDKLSHKSEKLNIRNGFRTSIQADFCNPNFDETFKFTNVSAVTLTDYVLQIVVKEETPKFLEKNKVIGYVDFSLKNAELIKKHESITDIHRDIIPTGPVVNKGQAVLSLHYNRELAIISASIIEIISSSDELSAVSVELYTRSIDNIIHKKKTNLENNLRSSDVLEFPMENCFLNSVCLVVVIYARVRNCSKTPYGRFIVGPIRFTDGLGLTHWAEMTVGNQMCIKSHSIV